VHNELTVLYIVLRTENYCDCNLEQFVCLVVSCNFVIGFLYEYFVIEYLIGVDECLWDI